jgi:NAD(P)-dependent dehydrogenase (short-subunit alcohol dehydrogenase family)
LHVLINTAGAIIDRRLDRATDPEWEWMLNANLFTQVRSVAVLLPLMRNSDGFRHIVTTAALAGFAVPRTTGSQLGLYSTVKHAVVGYSDALREELRGEGIGVSLLLPHRVRGNMAANSARSFALAIDDESGVGDVDPPAGELTSARDVGSIVVAAIQRRQHYVFTRPVDLSAIEQRGRELRDAATKASFKP